MIWFNSFKMLGTTLGRGLTQPHTNSPARVVSTWFEQPEPRCPHAINESIAPYTQSRGLPSSRICNEHDADTFGAYMNLIARIACVIRPYHHRLICHIAHRPPRGVIHSDAHATFTRFTNAWPVANTMSSICRTHMRAMGTLFGRLAKVVMHGWRSSFAMT